MSVRLLTCLVLAAALSPALARAQTPPTPAPLPSAAPSMSPSIAPVPTLSSAPPPAPVLPPTPLPTAIPTVAPTTSPYGYTYQPPQTSQIGPRILEIDLTDRIIRPGLMQLRVLADPSVTSVIVRSMGRQFALPQQAAGVFTAANMVPNIPFFLRGRTLWVDIVATRQDGSQTQISLPIQLMG